MASKEVKPPDFTTLAHLKTFLRKGRIDYDWVAGRVYSACYNDPYVMLKILSAEPEDVQSSEAEGFSGDEDSVVSEDEFEEGDGIPEEDSTVEDDGTKNNPVLIDEDASAAEGKHSSEGKRKRSASEVEVRPANKKGKSQVELLLCLNCGSKFNPKKNKEGACRYHPEESVLGELELNPTCDQIEDDEDSRETWANAFHWNCCEVELDDDHPCEEGRHRAEGDQTEYSRRQQRGRRRNRYYG